MYALGREGYLGLLLFAFIAHFQDVLSSFFLLVSSPKGTLHQWPNDLSLDLIVKYKKSRRDNGQIKSFDLNNLPCLRANGHEL